jgi:hypothetical protein
MKPTLICCCFAAIASATLALSLPVLGQDTTDMLSKALDLVHQVEKNTGDPLTDAQRIQLLQQAIQAARQAPNHRLQGHRVLAIQAIRTAIDEIGSGDKDNKAAACLQTADTELSTSISLAGATDATNASTTPAPTVSAPVAAQAPASNIVANPPPGVTPQMEQDFLAKYQAALKKQDPDAYFALAAIDPQMDAKAKEDFKGLMLLSAAMASSNPNQTYSFVPVAPGQHNQPYEIAGKMYGDYLPTVIALKTTFGKPPPSSANESVATGDSTFNLCVQDHQLMIVGPKEIPGAVPPPAVNKAANFGIKPNLRKVGDNVKFEDENTFASLNEFLLSLKQPSLEVLASGETKYEYYAICRIAPNLCVYAGGEKPEHGDYSFYIKAADSNKQPLKGSQTWIRLVDIPTDNGQAPDVQGTVFTVPDHYSGPVTVEAQYSDGKGAKSFSVSRTVDWK